MSYTDEFVKKNKFKPDELFIRDNLIMECVMGSQAYGVANKDSDIDIIGITMNPHKQLFPQKYGYVRGFHEPKMFTNLEIKGPQKRIILENGIDCEGEWHSLVDFFNLGGLKASPNVLEILFVRRPLVTHGSNVAWILRDNRRLFLSMKCFDSLKNYAHAQLMRIKRGVARWGKEHTCENSKRKEYFENFGYDVKQAYHPLRLLDNLHQILTTDDIDLMKNNKECQRMRKGELYTFTEFEQYVNEKINSLEKIADMNNSLSIKPQRQALQQLLIDCIEEHYGSEENFQDNQTEYVSVKELKEHLDRIETKIDKLG